MDEQRVEIICLMDEGGAVMNVHFDKAGTLLRTTAEKHPPVIYDARGNGGGISLRPSQAAINHE